jgi:hypothetical protein
MKKTPLTEAVAVTVKVVEESPACIVKLLGEWKDRLGKEQLGFRVISD